MSDKNENLSATEPGPEPNALTPRDALPAFWAWVGVIFALGEVVAASGAEITAASDGSPFQGSDLDDDEYRQYLTHQDIGKKSPSIFQCKIDKRKDIKLNTQDKE